jgi:carbonic anhydrase
VERVAPSIQMGRIAGLSSTDEFETRHVIETVSQLEARSRSIAERLDAGTLAIAGATYHLADGKVALRHHLGNIGQG